MLSDAGFDPASDIRAITVNRGPHGYAGAGNDLYDPDWSHDQAPWIGGRKRFGRITIASQLRHGCRLSHPGCLRPGALGLEVVTAPLACIPIRRRVVPQAETAARAAGGWIAGATRARSPR